MTNLLVFRRHGELGSVSGVLGKRRKRFDYSWGSHEAWFNGKCANSRDDVNSFTRTLFELCAEKMLKQGITDDDEIPFIARVKGKRVKKLEILSEEEADRIMASGEEGRTSFGVS